MLRASPHLPVTPHPRNAGARAQPWAGRRARLAIAATALCALLAFSQGVDAQARMYAIEPVHTRVMFAVDHAGFSRAIGTVSGTTGTLRMDPGDWPGARVEAWIPLDRLDLGDAEWNAASLAGNLLDARRHPHAVFVSERVEAASERRLYIHGRLTLRGVTRPVVLEAVVNDIRRHPMPPFRRTAGFSAVAMLSRADFGISAWPGVIGDEVELRIEVEAVEAPDAEFTGAAAEG